MSVRFCCECNNMMYPREDTRKAGGDDASRALMYVCRSCGTTEDVGEGNKAQPTYRNVLTKDRMGQGTDTRGVAHDPTLTRIHVDCRNQHCESKVAVTWLRPVQKNDTKLVTLFSCVRCMELWSSESPGYAN